MRTDFFVISLLLSVMICCGGVSVSCTRESAQLRSALRVAGENRSEIEKLLKYYPRRGEDALKRKAAQFLVRNMPGHVSVSGEDYFTYRDSLRDIFGALLPEEAMVSSANELISRHTPPLITQDIRTLSADYLIRNIDHSFKMWRNSPFLQHLGFEDFCEIVLPYKCYDGQPCDNWKEDLAPYGAAPLERMKDIDEWRHGVRAAVESVNDAFGLDMTKPLARQKGLGNPSLFDLEGLKSLPYLTCLEMTRMGVVLGRSCGLPVAMEYLPNWAVREQGHFWNVALAENGRIYDYVPFESKPQDPHHQDKKRAKAYRMTFAPDPLMKEALRRGVELKRPMNDIFIKDVTERFNLVSDIKVPVKGHKQRFAYLAVFDDEQWVPVQLGRLRWGKAIFNKVGRDVLYIVLSADDGALEPLCDPFILDIKGTLRSISPDPDAGVQDIVLTRKFPAFSHIWWVRDSLRHCVLEASDTPAFARAEEAARWEDQSMFSADREINLQGPHRYWRFRSLVDEPSSIAELYFYENGERIRPVSVTGPDAENLIDNYARSFMRVRSDRAAVLDFGRPVKPDRVAMMRRSDSNCIQPDETYQLYYWDKDRWILQEEKTAEDIRIVFRDVPKDRLYRVRDISSGFQHRTFLYVDGKAVWF